MWKHSECLLTDEELSQIWVTYSLGNYLGLAILKVSTRDYIGNIF